MGAGAGQAGFEGAPPGRGLWGEGFPLGRLCPRGESGLGPARPVTTCLPPFANAGLGAFSWALAQRWLQGHSGASLLGSQGEREGGHSPLGTSSGLPADGADPLDPLIHPSSSEPQTMCVRAWGFPQPTPPEPSARRPGVGRGRGTPRPTQPQDQQLRWGKGWPAGREARSPAMPAAAAEGQPAALSLAEKAVCKVVYGAPRPRPLLLPVGLELWLYVQKMRNLQRRRWVAPGRAGAAQAACRPRGQAWEGRVERAGASGPGRPAWRRSRWPPRSPGARAGPPSVCDDVPSGGPTHPLDVWAPGPSQARNLCSEIGSKGTRPA